MRRIRLKFTAAGSRWNSVSSHHKPVTLSAPLPRQRSCGAIQNPGSPISRPQLDFGAFPAKTQGEKAHDVQTL